MALTGFFTGRRKQPRPSDLRKLMDLLSTLDLGTGGSLRMQITSASPDGQPIMLTFFVNSDSVTISGSGWGSVFSEDTA